MEGHASPERHSEVSGIFVIGSSKGVDSVNLSKANNYKTKQHKAEVVSVLCRVASQWESYLKSHFLPSSSNYS